MMTISKAIPEIPTDMDPQSRALIESMLAEEKFYLGQDTFPIEENFTSPSNVKPQSTSIKSKGKTCIYFCTFS